MNRPKPNRRYSWDTSVFIAWLNDEQSAPLADIELLVRAFDAGTETLIVSGIVIPELLEVKMTEEQRGLINGFFRRPNVIKADATEPIFQKAKEVRERGLSCKPVRKVKTTDAIVVATAIIFKCDVLHSLDAGHIKLNGSPMVDGLRITRPMEFGGQRALDI